MAGNAGQVGERIEELLASLRSGRDRETAEELVRLLVELYGEGLSRIVAALEPNVVERLAADEMVESLLLIHDLHPLGLDARVQRALDRVRPYLGSHAGGVEYLGVDEHGVAHLQLQGNCEGCASSTLTVKMAIEGAVQDAAPELTGIEVAGVMADSADEPAAPLLQIGMGPPQGWAAEPPRPSGGNWATLPDLGPPTGRPTAVNVGGAQILVCSLRGTLYAYRDSCACCGSSLAEGTLNGNLLTCPSCGTRFNVRLAGRGLDGSDRHLDPLPLLSDSDGVRVALPQAVS